MGDTKTRPETAWNRGKTGIRRGWLIILAFIIQLVAIYAITSPSALTEKKAIFAISGILLLIGLLPNLRWWSFRVMLVGFLLNAVVMTANGGLMPLSPENAQRVFSDDRLARVDIGETPRFSKNVLLETSDTRLELLSDIIFISVPSKNIYSFGDVLLGVGVVIFGLESLSRVYSNRKARMHQRHVMETKKR